MSSTQPDTAQAAQLWKPFLFRAAVASAFGVLTIFWTDPSVHVMSVAGGLYLLLVSVAVLWAERSLRATGAIPTWLAGSAPAVLAIAALLNLWIHTDRMFAQVGALALVLAGVVELVIGFQQRGKHFAAKDFLLVGAISVLTGVLLPVFQNLGAHALMGVAGGGAVITAVILGLAGLSYRHDSLENSDSRARPEAVN
ncbi:hypothetical protein [Arthrobacter sp. H5]|uniref:hypothetical protein n=1 Tax=Arthrobacter sp. H5 TaxID=1267973 RepID=UPI000480F386|nr:hypothetical protein [Arthrobacter sp. H5]